MVSACVFHYKASKCALHIKLVATSGRKTRAREIIPGLYERTISSHTIYDADFTSLETGENYHFYHHFYLHLFYNTHQQCTYKAFWKWLHKTHKISKNRELYL